MKGVAAVIFKDSRAKFLLWFIYVRDFKSYPSDGGLSYEFAWLCMIMPLKSATGSVDMTSVIESLWIEPELKNHGEVNICPASWSWVKELAVVRYGNPALLVELLLLWSLIWQIEFCM